MKNVHPQLCSTHENQELLASTVANFGAWLHTHIVHYLVEEVIILIIYLLLNSITFFNEVGAAALSYLDLSCF